MTELRGFDFGGETSREWRSFAGRLADHLADMEDGDTLEIGLVGLPTEALGSGVSAVSFTGCEGTLVRAEVMVAPAVVTGEDVGERVSALQAMMSALGWHSDDSDGGGEGAGPSSYDAAPVTLLRSHQMMARREADHLASLTVRLLCEVLGAVHPVFLRASGDRDLVDRYPEGNPTADGKDREAPGVTEPTDSAHLRDLVTRTIAADLGTEPTRDDDGDIVLEAGTVRIFVRVLEPTPVIQIFARLVHDITLPLEAAAAVASLNADYSFVRFAFGDNAVVAGVHLPAVPFVPAQLRRMVAAFTELAGYLDDDLVRRLGGLRDVEPVTPSDPAEEASSETEADDEPNGVPPQLLALLRLDPDGHGLDAELTAKVCGYDQALTWQLLDIASGQEEVWREAAAQNGEDPEHDARIADEVAGWSATRQSLALALDLINSTDGPTEGTG